MSGRIATIASIIGATILIAGPASAYSISRCAKTAETAIDKLEIDRAKISEAKTDVQVSGGENMIVTGVNIWLKSASCKGSFVLVMTPSCEFVDTFDRGECTAGSFK